MTTRPVARRAGLAAGALLVTAAAPARADGERTPMLGAAVVGVSAPERDAELAGVAIEAAWWRGRLGLAIEGSMRWDLDDEGPRVAVLGGSARIRVLDVLIRSLLEPRDVELGIELHAIVEHAWWADGDAPAHGLGIAARLRGGSDDEDSLMLAESRLFVRVMTSRGTRIETLARGGDEMTARGDRELAVVIGLGASWGGGEPDYVAKFRWQAFEPWP